MDYEPAEALSRFFEAAAVGIEEQLNLPEHGVVIATRVVLRRARADTFGSHEPAFKIAGYSPPARHWNVRGARAFECCSSRRGSGTSHSVGLSALLVTSSVPTW
ncbi:MULTISPECIES: hypothetical protein [unclassified Streptomyces]|uniref:hypothetical protein n=1 Tax=unclassified Streptomyces TaxID=2593676 RepID=UPI002E177E8D